MIWNKKFLLKVTLVYKHQERHRVALTYMLICHYGHCLINTIILATRNIILNWHNIPVLFMNILNFELVEMPCCHNFPAPVINEAKKYIMHTSIGEKLFIGKLDYCLKVDEPIY